MAITYFGSASNPADADTGNDLDGSVARAVTPPASMQSGDLVYLVGMIRSGSVTPAISEAGGQTWNSLAVIQSGSTGHRVFWCQFNGTWSADPSVGFSGSTAGATVVMHVFRPTGSGYTVAVDVAQSASNFAAPTTPFDITATGITTLTNNALAVATFESADNNEWAVQTGGWSHAGLNQYRNSSGSDSSVSTVYQVKATAGATGDVINRQSTLGGDGGCWTIMAFKETAPAGHAGQLVNGPILRSKLRGLAA